MKYKMDIFAQYENARELSDDEYKLMLGRKTRNSEMKDMYDKGKSETKYEDTLKLFQFQYPDADIDFLKDLTFEQYKQIFDMLIDRKPLEEIKKIIDND